MQENQGENFKRIKVFLKEVNTYLYDLCTILEINLNIYTYVLFVIVVIANNESNKVNIELNFIPTLR